uniref:alpha/beta hydrolase n=1 Tax=Ndongobacter massiliensis TaxID=1871025 RepID=UPI0009309201|nr:alpha/beta hydrolase [Ndongobacter massiliensis]
MTLTYKIAAGIVRLLGVKKIFKKSKEDILEYAKKQNAKSAFDLEKAMKRARRKKYFLFDRKTMGHRVLAYQKNENPAKGAVLYLFGGGMITGPDRLDFSLSERIMKKTGKDVWFLFYPLCTADRNIKETYEVCFETYKMMTKAYEADNIGVLGFSSGACLALGVFLHNNALGKPLPMPGRIIAVSPGGLPNKNRAESKELWKKIEALNPKDIMIDPAYFNTAREIMKGKEDVPEYMLDGTCGDFSNFPKTYFYYGENECLYAYAEYFEKAMEKYAAPHEMVVGEGMCHCYPLLRFFREGREAQDQMIELLKS